MEKFKFIIAIVIMISFVLACNKSKIEEEDEDTKSERFEKLKDNDEKDEDSEVESKVVFGNPYLLQNSPYVLIPVRIVSTDENIFGKLKREYLSPEQLYSKYTDSYNRLEYGNMYNVIFYSSVDSTGYTLLNRKAYINKIYVPSGMDTDTTRGNYIIFTLIEEDYNGDKEIDEDDGETVYKCSLFGQDIRQISPDNVRLINWESDKADDRIYLYVTDDTNRDKKFDHEDASKIISTSISNSNIGKEVVSDSLKNSMNSLYIK